MSDTTGHSNALSGRAGRHKPRLLQGDTTLRLTATIISPGAAACELSLLRVSQSSRLEVYLHFHPTPQKARFDRKSEKSAHLRHAANFPPRFAYGFVKMPENRGSIGRTAFFSPKNGLLRRKERPSSTPRRPLTHCKKAVLQIDERIVDNSSQLFVMGNNAGLLLPGRADRQKTRPRRGTRAAWGEATTPPPPTSASAR